MRHATLVATLGLICASTFATPEILPIRGVRNATYDILTGQLTPTADTGRMGRSVWSAKELSGYYYAIQMYLGPGTTTLDWGDIAGPQEIGGFAVGYASDLVRPETLDVVVRFYAEENGHNCAGRVWLATFRLEDLPTSDSPGVYTTWVITVDLDAPGCQFTIEGSDIDWDGLVDFGYTYWFTDYTPTPENYTGPIIAGDPNVEGPGMEDAFDRFEDPKLKRFVGTRWFAHNPYCQFYMELFASNAPGCPSPGASGRCCSADIDGSGDCVVDLADLAKLLANYGVTSGATRLDGDVDPAPPAGDGDVDLGDLSELLSQYGDDCN